MSLKLLYYSTAYSASHGGSNHSKAFVKFAGEHSDVSEIRVYPQATPFSKTNISKSKVSLSERVAGLRVLLPLRLYKRNRQNIEGLYELLATFQPDVLVVRLDNNFLQLNDIRRRFPKLILVTEVNSSPFDESFKQIYLKSYFQKKEREALSKCDLNFFVSSFLRDQIMGDQVSVNRDLVNHNGYDETLFNADADQTVKETVLQIPANSSVIGYVGTLDFHKKMPLFIDAIASVKKTFGNIVAVIVGGGPALEDLKAYVAAKDLSDCFYFTGHVAHNEVHHYLKAFDIAVHHAANDYMSPLKVFEYLGVKLPVIAPDIPAVREIFVDGKYLLLTAPNSKDIEHKLTLLLENPEFAAEIAAEGYAYVNQNFTWRNNVDNIIQAVLKIKRIESHTTSAEASA
ncbi:glycosyltransferase family 4 protein [Pontibacter lucknowensis]|uniref:Glycosyltransferase involved in cell wall bisynthesis n=1 Tax=Pontibacter lucknowensis TaxID=1077936 RepID=A0A1N6Y7F1_9BACT|nr:glycosyltransferase family 4 protein [Pontibacter lucknowensis]SIR10565.1 Glycosyltransferase involved in cell wall bisynthesis [Pontibacter lucknowensis]